MHQGPALEVFRAMNALLSVLRRTLPSHAALISAANRKPSWSVHRTFSVLWNAMHSESLAAPVLEWILIWQAAQ